MCLVSIIVPIYNAETTIERCILSIINQSMTDWELILVDDGSTDNTSSICMKFQSMHPNIKYLYKTNSGVSSARNLGLKFAIGEYVSFVDPDDYILPSFLECLYAHVSNDGSRIVVCDYNATHKDDVILNFKENIVCGDCLFTQNDALAEIVKSSGIICGHVWDKLFPRKTINNLFFREDIHCYEDLLFCVSAFLHVSEVYFVNSVQYIYTQNDSSILNRRYSKKYFSSFKALDLTKQLLVDAGKVFLEKQCDCRILDEIVNQYIICLRSYSLKNIIYFSPLFRDLICTHSVIFYGDFKRRCKTLFVLVANFVFYMIACIKRNVAHEK